MKRLWRLLLLTITLAGCSNFEMEKQKADEMAQRISSMITAVENHGRRTVGRIIPLFENPESYSGGLFPDAEYVFHDDVMYHNPEDRGHGKFLYSGFYPVGDGEKRKVKVLEHAIPELQWLIHQSDYADYIVQTYLITFDTLIVFYPWSDLLAFIPPGRDIKSRGGWKAMIREANPQREARWTPPYVDTTGKGFVVDVMFPVDRGDFMEAFLGIDITISTLKRKFFDGIEEKMVLIDRTTSQIMAISDRATEVLGVENAEAFRYLSMIDNSEIARQVMPENLVLEKTGSPHMKELWSKIETSDTFTVSIDDKKTRIYRIKIEGPDWFLVLID